MVSYRFGRKLSIMLENPALHSRLLLVFALVGSDVMPFVMCSDAARASPITTQMNNGVKHPVRRQLYTPYNQHHPHFTGLPSTETGLQTGTNMETEISRNDKTASSMIDHQSNALRFIGGSFGYNQNIPGSRHSRAVTTGLQSEMTSAGSCSQHRGPSLERQQSRVNYQPLPGNSHYSNPVIIRKSSHKEDTGPVYQRSRPSQAWEFQENLSPKVSSAETVWQTPNSPLFSPQTSRFWSTSQPTTGGHYSSYKETNDLAVVGLWSPSSGIQSSKFRGFTSQTAPRAPSISTSLDSSVIKSSPSSEKLASSITDFSQELPSWSSSEPQRHKKVQSYLFKDSHTSSGAHETVNTVTSDGQSPFSATPQRQRPSDVQIYGRFPSIIEHSQQPQREEPHKEVQHLSDNANTLFHNANLAQYSAPTGTLTRYQHTKAENLAPTSVYPAPGTVDVDLQGNYATESETSVVSSLVNTTTKGSIHAYKPGQTMKTIYGFRGFKKPEWRAAKEQFTLSASGSNERTNSRRYSFDKGKFKILNIYPSLSPKYRFGQREASTAPAKHEKTSPTDYSSPSITQTMTTPRLITSGLTAARLPESDADVGSNPDRRQFRIYRRLFGHKGFGSRPLEGAKSSFSESDKSARVQQGLEGFRLKGSQSWQPTSSRIHRWYNKTEPGSSHVSTESQSEESREELKSLLKTTGSTRFLPDKYKTNRKIYSHMGFQPIRNRASNKTQTHWRYKGRNTTTAVSSAYLRAAGDLNADSSPKSEPRPPNKPAAARASLFNRSTSSTVRGKRVKGKHANSKKLNESASLTSDAGNIAIVRLSKRPARVKAVTYTDILGSASFSGVRATTQAPITPPDDKEHFNTTATSKQKEEVEVWTMSSDVMDSRDNTSRAAEEDFSRVGGNKLGVGGEEDDGEIKASDLFLDVEGSGSGDFNASDVLSPGANKSQGLGEDLLELDYLRISTGNISFKSMKSVPG